VFLAASDASSQGVLMSSMRTLRGIDGLISFSAPVFAFGRTYAVVARPDDGFTREHPAREGWRALAMGLALTALGSTLIGLLATRRARLEHQVAERTVELRRSEESYRGLFNAIQQSIYIQDAQGRFVDVNEGAVTRYGYAREEFIGRTPGFLAAPGRNDMATVQQAFLAAWEGQPQYFEFWGRTKTGEEFPKEVWLCKGTYLGQDVIIAVASDISDRKRSEEENHRLQAQLLQSQKMESIGRLAGGVAHDFNNMLQAIIGNANLAKMETPPGSALADYLTEIELSAQRSARLTRQLLAFASKQTVQPRILDLNDTVAGMLKMLQRLIGENIQLNWKPGPNLWPVKVDPGQIDQILANLAVNARDAIRDSGHIEIATENYICNPDDCQRSCTRCRPCRYVEIRVTDDGCGMTDEVRQHLFEPFFTTKEPGKGTGLGLATVFGIVHQNDGVIEVESAPGQGATFRIMLPMIDTNQLPQPAIPEPQDAVSGRETILLVEDEAVILNMGMVSLQRLGYTVLVAATPTVAMRIARDYPDVINLLITDVILPDLDGMELARRVRELRPDIHCLYMSGYTADVISDRGVLDESVHFIQKPFTISALAAKIRDVLDGRG
jgi:PAS domain S-box-containing protein